MGSLCISVQELELPMLKVAAPELVSGVSGESEQKLRELFDLAVVSTVVGEEVFLLRGSLKM